MPHRGPCPSATFVRRAVPAGLLQSSNRGPMCWLSAALSWRHAPGRSTPALLDLSMQPVRETMVRTGLSLFSAFRSRRKHFSAPYQFQRCSSVRKEFRRKVDCEHVLWLCQTEPGSRAHRCLLPPGECTVLRGRWGTPRSGQVGDTERPCVPEEHARERRR